MATALSRAGDDWLVAVSDSSPGVPPNPAQGRDPGNGGFGLYLVADLSVRHGWFVERGAKTVWAVIAAAGTEPAFAGRVLLGARQVTRG